MFSVVIKLIAGLTFYLVKGGVRKAGQSPYYLLCTEDMQSTLRELWK